MASAARLRGLETKKATSGAEPTVRSEGVTAFNKGAEVARRKVIDFSSVDRREQSSRQVSVSRAWRITHPGHEAGDRVLCHFARVLEEGVRRSDFVGRHGGDEFLAVLVGVETPVKAQQIADSMIERISQPIAWGMATARTWALASSLLSRSALAMRQTLFCAEPTQRCTRRSRMAGRKHALPHARPFRCRVPRQGEEPRKAVPTGGPGFDGVSIDFIER